MSRFSVRRRSPLPTCKPNGAVSFKENEKFLKNFRFVEFSTYFSVNFLYNIIAKGKQYLFKGTYILLKFRKES